MASSKRDMGERIGFVKFWANRIKKTPNKKWSREHSDFVNSVMDSANVDPKLYLKIKSRLR